MLGKYDLGVLQHMLIFYDLAIICLAVFILFPHMLRLTFINRRYCYYWAMAANRLERKHASSNKTNTCIKK